MKFLRLSVWVLAPLFMIVLGYLFHLPPLLPEPVSPGAIAIVILDPVSREIIDQKPESAPVLSKLRGTGMCGTVLPGGYVSMEEAVCEIFSGKDSRKLARVPRMFDSETYSFRMHDTAGIQDGMLPDILERQGRVVTCILPGADEPVAGAADKSDVIIVYLPRNEASESEYLALVNEYLHSYTGITGTWLVISPMHRRIVSRRFHINQWLLQNGYLAVNPDGSTDYADTQAFYAGENEPGVRVNRSLSYASGAVPRAEYEDLLKTLGQDLRRIVIPADENLGGGGRLFGGIYRGEESYPRRHEGGYPDIEWELRDETVEIVSDLPGDPSADPWQDPGQDTDIDRPGGWMCLFGPSFDIIVEDETGLDTLLAADITPTVLFLLGLPAARDMQGRILQPLMTETLQLRTPAAVDGYSFHDPFVEQEL
jgi:hypothetical protein